jgi:hypothetical protein
MEYWSNGKEELAEILFLRGGKRCQTGKIITGWISKENVEKSE